MGKRNLFYLLFGATTGGGGATAEVTPLNVKPSTQEQTFQASSGGYSPVNVEAVTASIDSNIKPTNIRAGVTVLGVEGNLEPDKPDQTKTVTPTTAEQKVVADTGYELAEVTVKATPLDTKNVTPSSSSQTVTPTAPNIGLSSVSVSPVPVQNPETITANGTYSAPSGKWFDKVIVSLPGTSDATATAADIRLGKTAYVASGKVTGSIPDYDGTVEGGSEADAVTPPYVKEVYNTAGKMVSAIMVGQKTVRDYAFAYSDLVSIDLPSSLVSIGSYAFRGCQLDSISVPAGVTSIGANAFESCAYLSSINIPDTVSTIGNSAFFYCIRLSSIVLPSALSSISSNLFNQCTSLTDIIVPNTVASIGVSAFYQCTSLNSITIGSGTTSIGKSAFALCNTLSHFNMKPSTPPRIESGMLDDARDSLQIVVPKGSLDAYKAATNWSTYADKMVEADT